ncbi:hypothetical protein AAF712_001686 [Marasmius tenuissimus]|uniref:Uncharacterized protein n=1 Tax=Marasmius tenuissimus TaxID=585030 RepID=A0ABR3ABN2_9AGAR
MLTMVYQVSLVDGYNLPMAITNNAQLNFAVLRHPMATTLDARALASRTSTETKRITAATPTLMLTTKPVRPLSGLAIPV